MQIAENPGLGMTMSQDDPYLMMNHEKRMEMRAALEKMQRYCEAHPESASAIQRPKLLVRGGVWIAFLGHGTSEGITGFGHTVEATLRAFDARYLLVSRSSLRASSPAPGIA